MKVWLSITLFLPFYSWETQPLVFSGNFEYFYNNILHLTVLLNTVCLIWVRGRHTVVFLFLLLHQGNGREKDRNGHNVIGIQSCLRLAIHLGSLSLYSQFHNNICLSPYLYKIIDMKPGASEARKKKMAEEMQSSETNITGRDRRKENISGERKPLDVSKRQLWGIVKKKGKEEMYDQN